MRAGALVFADEFEALAGEGETVVVLFAATQGKDGGVEGFELAQVLNMLAARAAIPGLEAEGEVGVEDGEEVFRAHTAGSVVGRGAGAVGGAGEEFAVELPLDEAAVAPIGEVLFGDGAITKVGGEEGGDFGEGIEPIGEVAGEFTVFEAVVEFFAKGLRETGDFSGAGHSGGGFWFAKTIHPVFFGKCRFRFSWPFVALSTAARGISSP